MRLNFSSRGTTPSFEAELGATLADTPTTVLQEARLTSGEAVLPEAFVTKRAKKTGDVGRIDLEQLACERLDHPGLGRYYGAARDKELGTILAFERLAPNPLVLLNKDRPSFRDPGTFYFPLPPGIALELAFDMLMAIEHAHSRGFVHGGVTITNLLVRTPANETSSALGFVAEGNYEGVLAGLGGARSFSFLEQLKVGEVDHELTPKLPPLLSAPEAVLELPELGGRVSFTPAMDVYAFGLAFYTMLTGRQPYDHLRSTVPLRLLGPDGGWSHMDVVLDFKHRELRREISSWKVEALDTIPLHDVAFRGAQFNVWPEFRSAVEHVIRHSTIPDPRSRITAAQARQFFEDELRLRPSASSAARPWSQVFFQMRASSNRLRGDRPSEGLSLTEGEGDEVVVEERKVAAPPRPAPPSLKSPDGSLVMFRHDDLAMKTAVTAHRGMLTASSRGGMRSLRELLMLVKAKTPHGLSGPFVVTNTSLAPKELARTFDVSLGSATTRLRVSDNALEERTRITIGRGEGNDIIIADASVSKQHGVFERKQGAWHYIDVGSSNGSAVGGRVARPKVPVRLIGNYVQISLGTGTTISFMEDSDFNKFLQKALAVVVDAMFTGTTGKPPPTDKISVPIDAKRETVKLPRSAVQRKTQIEFPLVRRPDPTPPPARPALPKDLEKQLRDAMLLGTRYRVVKTGGRIDVCDTVDEALEVVNEDRGEVQLIEVLKKDSVVTLYSSGEIVP